MTEVAPGNGKLPVVVVIENPNERLAFSVSVRGGSKGSQDTHDRGGLPHFFRQLRERISPLPVCTKKEPAQKRVMREGKNPCRRMQVSYFSDRNRTTDYDLLFFINRIKSKVIIDYHKTNAPTPSTGLSTRRNFLWQVGTVSLSVQSQHLTDYLRHQDFEGKFDASRSA